MISEIMRSNIHPDFFTRCVLFMMVINFIITTESSECKSFYFNVSVDDYMIIYIDGEPVTGLPNAFNWHLANPVKLSCDTKVIAVQGINFVDVGGIRGSDEIGFILTNNSWKCTNISYPGWEKIHFDDSSWPSAVVTDWGTNREIPGIRNESQWIWTKDWRINTTTYSPNSNLIAFCRKTLNQLSGDKETVTYQTQQTTTKAFTNDSESNDPSTSVKKCEETRVPFYVVVAIMGFSILLNIIFIAFLIFRNRRKESKPMTGKTLQSVESSQSHLANGRSQNSTYEGLEYRDDDGDKAYYNELNRNDGYENSSIEG